MEICLTGASKGLGRALCRELARRGHNVWGVARDEVALCSLEEECPKGAFRWSVVDVKRADALHSWGGAMQQASFEPDIVVLNASVQLNDMRDDFDLSKGEEVIETNLQATLRCINQFLPNFRKRSSGSFVSIGSTVSLRPSVRSASYAGSKAGLEMIFRTLRLRYRTEGIRFRSVILGPVATDMWEGRRSFLVPTPEEAARAIASFLEGGRERIYYPFLSTTLLRLTLPLPDRVFSYFSTKLLK